MTEQHNDSAATDETRVEESSVSQNTGTTRHAEDKKKQSGSAGIALGVVAIAIALACSAGVWTWAKHQLATQTSTSDTVIDQLTALQHQQTQQNAALQKTVEAQADTLAQAHKQQQAQATQLSELEQKVATISGSDAKTWMLSQADFLVKLAARKLWSDQDVTTAAALLKSADASLADMNDPSLLPARRAITQDLSTLSALTQVDYDGIILQLNQLTNQIDNLRLADNTTDDTPMDDDSSELSGSFSQWRENLTKSWHNFMDSFITIRRRDETAVPLLAPNQDVYLRENLRSRLLVAAQAVPRHQDEVYKQALENVSTWVRAYYDTNDAATKAFLQSLDSLSQQDISMDVPDSLQSQPILEKLMQTRVRNLLSQPGVSADSGDATTQPVQGE